MTSTIQKNSIKYSRVDSRDRWFRSSHVSALRPLVFIALHVIVATYLCNRQKETWRPNARNIWGTYVVTRWRHLLWQNV